MDVRNSFYHRRCIAVLLCLLNKCCYFYQTLHDLDESVVINMWKAISRWKDKTDCPACLSQIKSVHNSNWREIRMKTHPWIKKLFQTVYRMIQLERKVYV